MSANVQRAVFAYSYEVGGQAYRGHRAAFGIPVGFGMGLGGVAAAQAARYAPGVEVDVWVDPADPSNSVLRRTAPSSLVLALLGVGLLIASVLSLASG